MWQPIILTMMTAVCMAFCTLSVHGVDATALAMRGMKMTSEEALELEKKLEQDPDDINARTKLLGYYFQKKYSDKSALAAQEAIVLWLVKNKPRAEVLRGSFARLDAVLNPDAYQEAKKEWLAHLKEHPADLEILEMSAAFFLVQSRELAEQSLLKAQSLAPKDPKWPSKLGELYSLSVFNQSKHEKKTMAAKSFEQLELAYELTADDARDPMLGKLAKMAFESENTELAKKYATQMLKQSTNDWNTGNNVFSGNTILGRLALRAKDVEKAKQYLLAAGKTTGSPQLGSFGPSMRLAKELIEAGETECVLEFFDLCSAFWGMGKERLEQWARDVKQGSVPAFGANLNY